MPALPRERRLPRLRPTRHRVGARGAAWRATRLRRALALALVAAACWLALGPLGTRAPAGTTPVLAFAADLPVGHHLRAADLVTVAWPEGHVPAGALADAAAAAGRTLAAPVARGEAATAGRMRGGGASLPPGTRAVHLPLGDGAAASGVGPGDHLDLIAVADGGLVVADAVVVDVDRGAAGPFGAAGDARGLTVAVPSDKVGRLTSAALAGGKGGVHVALRPS